MPNDVGPHSFICLSAKANALINHTAHTNCELLDLWVTTETAIIRISPNTLMACYQITRVNILLDFEKPVVILPSPKAVDVIWLIGIGFVLIGTAIGGDLTQRAHEFASFFEALNKKFGGMRFLAIGVPS